VSWSRRFDEPIELPDGRKLKTLAEAIAYLAETVPKAERKHPKVVIAADHLTRAAEQNYSVIFARMATLQAIQRHHKQSSIPIAKILTGGNAS
jgi:hypothetical protein